MKKTALIAMLLIGCSADPVDPGTSADTGGSGSDVGSNMQAAVDQGAGRDDVGTSDMNAADVGSGRSLAATDYCELTASMFCDYYLRCGRIAAADSADCQTQFLETCNAAYEPQYTALADQGHLVLSQAGMDACAAHLAAVSCDRQVFDLDGGCAGMWRGQVPAGGACAPGIGSFVCGPGTACVLDLSLCGTCEPAGAAGEPCVDDRCASNAVCVDGGCIARGLPGDGCDDAQPCVVGIACDAGTCSPRTFVAVGDACDQVRRCPYQSTCRDGTCRQDALLGESCADAACASGWCGGDLCRSFITPGDNCAEAFQCLGGACEAGACADPIARCFQ